MVMELFPYMRVALSGCLILWAGLAGAEGPVRSALYPEDWTPAFTDEAGHFLHDFSYAGYHKGETPLPPATGGTIHDVTDYGADASGTADSTAGIQAAIDAAEGAGDGVVYFPAGLYRCDGTLEIEASHMTLRGAGAQQSRVYFTQSVGMNGTPHILFRGNVVRGPDIPLMEDVPNRSTVVKVADASALAPGDEVALGWVITPAFVEEHGMTGTWQVFNGDWEVFFRREVVAVDTSVTPHEVTLDVPTRYPGKVRDGVSLRIESGYLEECMVEDLGLSNAVGYDAAWEQNQVHVLELRGVKDSVVRNVASFAAPHPQNLRGDHLQSGGIEVRNAKRITVAACSMAKAQNRGGGGNGYLYEAGECSEVLFRDCTALAGRHNFIQNWGFGATGIVWLRCRSEDGQAVVLPGELELGPVGYSEYHHSLATANLVDSCLVKDGWAGGNRGSESSGAGHSAAQCVYWNINGAGTGRIRSFSYGRGYVIGTEEIEVLTENDIFLGMLHEGTAPPDYTEHLGRAGQLVPPSLYEDQRVRRLNLGGGDPTPIITGPATAHPGEPVTLEATGPNLSGITFFTWKKDGQVVHESETGTYHIAAATEEDSGVYWVIVTDLAKAVYVSDPFELTVAHGLPTGGWLGCCLATVIIALAGLHCARRLRRADS